MAEKESEGGFIVSPELQRYIIALDINNPAHVTEYYDIMVAVPYVGDGDPRPAWIANNPDTWGAAWKRLVERKGNQALQGVEHGQPT